MKLKDKVAIITGASSGIGRETALLFAKEGASVIATARRKERLDEIAEEAKEFEGSITAVAGDMGKDEDLQNIIDTTMDKFGRIDILINNAGVLDNFVPLDDLTDDLWDWVLKINLTSPMKLSRLALKIMLEQECGNIINVSSSGGLYGARAGAAYTASKHALVGLSKNIGYMYATQGIRCNVICPGGVDTEMTADMEPHEFGMERVMAGAGNAPCVATSEQLANTLLFLASEESSIVNGATLATDGGWTAY